MSKPHVPHRMLRVLTPSEIPEGSLDRKIANWIQSYWRKQGYDVYIEIPRFCYRPREKSESYTGVRTDMSAGLPAGYQGPMRKLVGR